RARVLLDNAPCRVKVTLVVHFLDKPSWHCLGVLLVHPTRPTKRAVFSSGTLRPILSERGRDRGHGLAAALEPRRTGQSDRLGDQRQNQPREEEANRLPGPGPCRGGTF